MANNTFTMVNEYFDLVALIRRCYRTMATQCLFKKVNLVGPLIANPVDKVYFKSVFGDERRYGQIILNFLSNAIKFTNSHGTTSVNLKIVEILDADADDDEQADQVNFNHRNDEDSNSHQQLEAPDKEVLSENDNRNEDDD